VILLFAEVDVLDSNTHLMDQQTTVRRWKETFFGVWDAEWEDDDTYRSILPYSFAKYRIEHRQTAHILFDHLIELADFWCDDQPGRDLQPFALEGTLPLMSLTRLKNRDGEERSLTGIFFKTFIHMLIRSIIFVLSEENREHEWGFDLHELEEVWIAVDIIGRLCEKYQISPGLRPATIHRWLDTTIGLWLDHYSEGPDKITDIPTLIEKEALYTNSVNVFVRLITVARQHPGGM
jgi:hypothetical protein